MASLADLAVQEAHSVVSTAAPEALTAYNTALMPAGHLTMNPSVYGSQAARGHSTLVDQLEPMVACMLASVVQLLTHYLPFLTEHSTLVDQLEPMAAYMLASVAAIRLMLKPLAYHWLAVTGHSIPVVAVSAELEVYTKEAQTLEPNLLQFAALQKNSEMWQYHIWNRTIDPALIRNYNLGNTLFVAPEAVHN